MSERRWNYDAEPTEEGWYAVGYCWDISEGAFVGFAYLDSTGVWSEKLPIFGSAGPFDTADEAELWAKEHDYT